MIQVRKSPQSKEKLMELTGKVLLFPSRTRWAGTILMINRFLEIWKNVNLVSINFLNFLKSFLGMC